MKLRNRLWLSSKARIATVAAALLALAGGLLWGSYYMASQFPQARPSYAPGETKTVLGDFDGELLFNNGIGETIFSSRLTDLIRNAEKTIDIALYSIDSASLRDELYAAANRNVRVRVVVSQNKGEQTAFMFANPPAGMTVTSEGQEASNLMHHKFMIVDRGTERSVTVFGSFNWTQLQEAYDPSFLCVTRDETVATVYGQEFERLYSGTTGKKKFNDSAYRPWAADIMYSNGRLELWWSPGIGEHSIKRRLIDAIHGARSSLDVMIWQLTDRDIVHALIAQAEKGVRVRVIADDYNAWREASTVPLLVNAAQKNPNLEIIDDAARTLDFSKEIIPRLSADAKNFNSFFHHHALIVDGTSLVAGTNNWSNEANYRNDESAFVTTVPPLVKEYQAAFLYHYEHLHRAQLEAQLSSSAVSLPNMRQYKDKHITIVGEYSKGEPSPDVCFSQKIVSDSLTLKLPPECAGKIINIYVLDPSGAVVANRLWGSVTAP